LIWVNEHRAVSFHHCHHSREEPIAQGQGELPMAEAHASDFAAMAKACQ
jgi:hypothetical protein